MNCIISLLLVTVGMSFCEVRGQSAGEDIEDSIIRRAIESDFMWDEGVDAHLIDVTSRDGIVILSGYVDNLLARDRAEQIAETVRGVRGIINTIEIRPVERSDILIRNSLTNAIAFDPALEKSDISLEVTAGRVTLQGTVDSYTERALAYQVAKGVAGITEINNTIRVVPPEDRSDNEIKADIIRRFEVDPSLHKEHFAIQVTDGIVSLSGTAGSIPELKAVMEKAKVAGVTNIDTGGLEIKDWAGDWLRKRKKLAVSDPQIKDAVFDVLRHDPRVLPFKIEVDIDNGMVTLEGNVDNLKARNAAEEDVKNVIGVVDVANRIKVTRSITTNDWEIEKNILSALKWDPYLDQFDISVWVENTRVSIYGEVDNYFQKKHAGETISRINNVTAIDNRLLVQTGPGAQKSDMVIKKDIQERLAWNAAVDEENISVEVSEGTARLTGVVDTWEEYNTALNYAFNSGATTVKMEIKIKNYGLETYIHRVYGDNRFYQ
ncbi:MAG: BON domain-containing protein [Chitinivibrionales bacterium]|nr:BON domain-containing protein [Chitinivibrionales bacterium]